MKGYCKQKGAFDFSSKAAFAQDDTPKERSGEEHLR